MCQETEGEVESQECKTEDGNSKCEYNDRQK